MKKAQRLAAPEVAITLRLYVSGRGYLVAIELAELIGTLRAELTAALEAGEGALIQFELGTVELDLVIAVDKEASPGAKVRFWVVELGSEAKISSSKMQRIRLKLDPRASGQRGHRPLISGEEEPGER